MGSLYYKGETFTTFHNGEVPRGRQVLKEKTCYTIESGINGEMMIARVNTGCLTIDPETKEIKVNVLGYVKVTKDMEVMDYHFGILGWSPETKFKLSSNDEVTLYEKYERLYNVYK